MDVRLAYEQWLKDFADDADTVADLKAIADNPAEIEDRFYTELSFGTAGMRGVIGAGLNQGPGPVPQAGSREREARRGHRL